MRRLTLSSNPCQYFDQLCGCWRRRMLPEKEGFATSRASQRHDCEATSVQRVRVCSSEQCWRLSRRGSLHFRCCCRPWSVVDLPLLKLKGAGNFHARCVIA